MPTYVQHEALGKIDDVFNPDAIWQSPGLALFARRPLLRDLLERAPREQRGRAATRCFAHVTLLLPQDEIDDDRHLTRGARARDLAQGLAALHQKDFGDLLKGDDVRYHVAGADTLAPGEVEVKFGHAVYLPAPGEAIQYTVAVSRDSAVWKTVCPIYPNQRLTLIGHDEHLATYAAPGWPFGADGAILIVNDGPDAAPEIQVRPKDAFDCRYDEAGGYHVIRSRRGAVDAAGAPARLLLRVVPAQWQPAPEPLARPAQTVAQPVAQSTAAPARPAVWKARPALDDDRTAVPQARPAPVALPAAVDDATYAPVARQRVVLAALALPRLSRYRDTGAQSLRIGLNRALAPSVPGKDSVLAIAVDGDDVLYAISAAGRERITAPATFSPFDGATLQLLAAAPQLADRYAALLRLPQGPSLPLAPGLRCVFGRAALGRAAPPLAALRVLDAPGFLQVAGGRTESADRLGLSRSAFTIEAGADGWRIARASPAQALYHLDPQLAFVATILEATPEQPYVLPAGHHLVAGHYVLRFDA